MSDKIQIIDLRRKLIQLSLINLKNLKPWGYKKRNLFNREVRWNGTLGKVERACESEIKYR